MANGTNYTLYYNVLNYLKTIMKNHPSINFVSQGDAFSIDTKEFPQYPLGNVIITTATFDDKSTDYGVQITIADKTKLKANESSGSNNQQTIEFEGVDDTVDIHANTLSIVNDILSYTDRKEEGFEIQGTTSCTAFKERFDNGLAGWSADFTLRVHNDRNICLFDLNPNDNVDAYKIESCEASSSLYVTFKDAIPVGSGSIKFDNTCYSISGSESVDETEIDFLSIPSDFYSTCNECIECNRWTFAIYGVQPPYVRWTDCSGIEQEQNTSDPICAIGTPFTSGSITAVLEGICPE